jgi:hypothetical protein
MNEVGAATEALGSAGASQDTLLEKAFPMSNSNSLRFKAGRLKEGAGRPRSPTTSRAHP